MACVRICRVKDVPGADLAAGSMDRVGMGWRGVGSDGRDGRVCADGEAGILRLEIVP